MDYLENYFSFTCRNISSHFYAFPSYNVQLTPVESVYKTNEIRADIMKLNGVNEG